MTPFPDTPDILFGQLFEEVQLSGIFEDSKTFADAVPKISTEQIVSEYEMKRHDPSFRLIDFVQVHFDLPGVADHIETDLTNIEAHIDSLWLVLQRNADTEVPASSLLSLPFPYIVPGGRFREIYYWDSFFTMLGLKQSGKTEIIRNMVRNFDHLIKDYGHIPNGNRSYFLSRSQPPFFACMVQLLAEIDGEKDTYKQYLPSLLREYAYWMEGSENLSDEQSSFKRVVLHKSGSLLNRYYDDYTHPRQESYAEDIELSSQTSGEASQLYLDIRAACESGWDFSSRWFSDPEDITSIHTTDILPVDLNVLMYTLENTIAKAAQISDDIVMYQQFSEKALRRKAAINELFWSAKSGFYMDVNWVRIEHTEVVSLAGVFPLWQKLSDRDCAASVVRIIEEVFIKPGGLLTTPYQSGQQWDAPNGWAPLQWIVAEALDAYGYHIIALDIRLRWTELIRKVFHQTGKIMEKYNVEDMTLLAGGGEYPVQDGFGWTNGVYLDFVKKLHKDGK
jgi:alpha,alpha-trehalase